MVRDYPAVGAENGRREMAQATVYQKHSTLLSRLRRCIGCDACPMPKGQKEMSAARRSIEFKPW